MSYEREILFDNNIIHFEYSLGNGELKLDSWKLYKINNDEVIPDKETAEEIEILLANWLEKEYSKYALYYKDDYEECLLEKRYYES